MYSSRIVGRPQQLALRIFAGGIAGLTALLALAGLMRIVPALLRGVGQIDFAAYYVAARVLNLGGELYRPAQMAAAAEGIHHTGYIYPPFLAVLLRPLALLPYRNAEIVWLLCNLAWLGLSVVLLGRVFRLRAALLLPLLGAALLLPAVYDTMLIGQTSLLLTALMAGALYWSLDAPGRPRNDWLAGVCLGLAIAVKVYPAALLLAYLVHRRYRALLATALTLATALIVGVLGGGGLPALQRWVAEVLPAISAMASFPSNQSLHAVLARLFSLNQFSVPVLSRDNYLDVVVRPIVDAPLLGRLLAYLAAAVVVVASALRMRADIRRSVHPHAVFLHHFALAITVMLLITPVVWDLYLVHLLPPLLLLGLAGRRSTAPALVVLGALLLLVLERYWRWLTQYAQSPLLMMFGFLVVALLWWVLLRFDGGPAAEGAPAIA